MGGGSRTTHCSRDERKCEVAVAVVETGELRLRVLDEERRLRTVLHWRLQHVRIRQRALFLGEAPSGRIDLTEIRAGVLVLTRAVQVRHIDCLVTNVPRRAVGNQLIANLELALDLTVSVKQE